jgi:hypothetical protein
MLLTIVQPDFKEFIRMPSPGIRLGHDLFKVLIQKYYAPPEIYLIHIRREEEIQKVFYQFLNEGFPECVAPYHNCKI